MARQRNAFRLGVTVILFFGLFVGVLLFIARPRGGERFVVRFPAHAMGLPVLKPGSLIYCGAEVVGTVDRVETRAIRPEEPAPADGSDPDRSRLYAFVYANARKSVSLRKDCTIVPETPIFGGTGALRIQDRGVGPPMDPDAPIDGKQGAALADLTQLLANQLDPKNPESLLAKISSQLDATDAASLVGKLHRSLDDLNAMTVAVTRQLDRTQQGALMAKLHDILDNVNAMTASLREQLDPRRDNVVIDKVNQALDSLNAGLATAVEMINENRGPIGEAVGYVRDTAKTLDEVIAVRIARQLDVENAAGLLAKVHLGIDRLNRSIEDMNAVTGDVREVVTLNKEQVNRFFANFKETSDHLKAAAKEIRRSPWRLLYRPSPDEREQQNVFDAARAFADAATQLDDAVVRLQALAQAREGRLASDDKELLAIRDQLQRTFGTFTDAENALWEQLGIR